MKFQQDGSGDDVQTVKAPSSIKCKDVLIYIFSFLSSTCKTNFVGYEDLKVHRQLHEGGNRKLTLLVAQVVHKNGDFLKV